MQQIIEETLAPERWPAEEADLMEEEESWLELTEDMQFENEQSTLVFECASTNLNLSLDLVSNRIQSFVRELANQPRKEQLDIYFASVDKIRTALYAVTTRTQLNAIVDIGVDLDRAMLLTNDWRNGFDTFDKLEREFEWAEDNIKRLEAIQESQDKKSEYARLYWLERSKIDYQRVSA